MVGSVLPPGSSPAPCLLFCCPHPDPACTPSNCGVTTPRPWPSQSLRPEINPQSSNHGTRRKELEETFAFSHFQLLPAKSSRSVHGSRSRGWASAISYPFISDAISKTHTSSPFNHQAPSSWAGNTSQVAAAGRRAGGARSEPLQSWSVEISPVLPAHARRHRPPRLGSRSGGVSPSHAVA